VAGIRIHRATPLDFLLALLPGNPRLSWRRQLGRGDRYFIARAGWRIVALGRICYAPTPEIRPEAGEASLISFYTAPAFRGRGLYVALIQAMVCYLHRQGFRAAYIWAERGNTASLRGIEKAGFTPIPVDPTHG
jgi:GNAT superfamily N-acetyltransferase